MHTYYQLGKKYAFPPFFYPLSIIFFPNLLFGQIFGKKEKYTPLSIVQLFIILSLDSFAILFHKPRLQPLAFIFIFYPFFVIAFLITTLRFV